LSTAKPSTSKPHATLATVAEANTFISFIFVELKAKSFMILYF
jgi:hypothetical protein